MERKTHVKGVRRIVAKVPSLISVKAQQHQDSLTDGTSDRALRFFKIHFMRNYIMNYSLICIFIFKVLNVIFYLSKLLNCSNSTALTFFF